MTSNQLAAPAKAPGLFRTIRLHTEANVSRFESAHLSAHLLVFLAIVTYFARFGPLWFDEIFTVSISRLPSVQEMFKAMPADGQPPLQYFLTRLSLHVFGMNELAARLPELIAYGFAGLLIYRIVRKHGTAIEALFALDLFLSSIVAFTHAYLARPYGLLTAFTALTFASWQSATSRESNRLLPLSGVAIGIAGAILSHHFGIFHVGLFMTAGETVRIIRRRRLDWPMLAAGASGLSALIVTVPLIIRSHSLLGQAVLRSTDFWARPRLLDLFTGYLSMIGLIPLIVASVALCLTPPGKPDADAPAPSSAVGCHEWTAAITLSLLLPAILLVSEFATGYFQLKYASGTVVGLSILCGWALPRITPRRAHVQYKFALSSGLTVAFFAIWLAALQWARPIWRTPDRATYISPTLLNAPGHLPIVIPSFFDFAPDWWYAPPSLQKRVVYLTDPQYAEKQRDFLGELSLADDHAYLPFHVAPYRGFLSTHHAFLLLRSGQPRLNWIESRLKNSGWNLTVLTKSGKDVLYKVTRTPGVISEKRDQTHPTGKSHLD